MATFHFSVDVTCESAAQAHLVLAECLHDVEGLDFRYELTYRPVLKPRPLRFRRRESAHDFLASNGWRSSGHPLQEVWISPDGRPWELGQLSYGRGYVLAICD